MVSLYQASEPRNFLDLPSSSLSCKSNVDVGDGPVGPMIIHSPDEVKMQKYYDVDQVVLIQDWYHDYSQALLPGYLASGSENGEPVPDNGLIQVRIAGASCACSSWYPFFLC